MNDITIIVIIILLPTALLYLNDYFQRNGNICGECTIGLLGVTILLAIFMAEPATLAAFGQLFFY